jgi:alanyl-tRNA synthetase/REP element-mobilizing transposase RayT
MMTSAQIRQSYLDFFREKQHTIVPSSSLLPDSPNLLFTNAGMNQFVPIFLGERRADVSRWAGAVPASDTRAADTQKCIRAGGKHNDLDDVGLDTYHHTFFEMLGNWSFGDYFKKEAIEWAWELVVERWKFPPQRVYATIYNPDKAAGDPSERDEEAWSYWAEKFRSVGLDPAVHIVNGNKKDNFWMMGDTGPCGPCSELHVDLTPAGDTKGALVNQGDARCIEIWNLVFIQFNANPDGTFSPLPAKHVDTGMGFERVTSIIQGTKGFSDFANAKISNYETDIFRPTFDELEKMCGRKYGCTLPLPNASGQVIPETEQEKTDVAFRVIADHIRTLSFAIADGIQPGNSDRNYVLRRILRRAVRYGRTLGFHEPFFYKLTAILAKTMGDVFPEIRARQKHVEEVLQREEESFNKTLDKGIELFEREAARLTGSQASGSTGRRPVASGGSPDASSRARYSRRNLPHFERPHAIYHLIFTTRDRRVLTPAARSIVLDCLRHWDGKRYALAAACVMPDHAHALIQPLIKENKPDSGAEFYSLSEILHTVKSYTAHEINQLEGTTGPIWTPETFDRYMRSDEDLEEKFLYIVDNPRRDGIVASEEEYPWSWWPGKEESSHNASGGPPAATGQRPVLPAISGAFAFRLYDEQGFPLDLTELMARERGLSVDTKAFNELMEQQRDRARKAQKRQVIELSEVETKEPTKFVGYDTLTTAAKVLEVVSLKDKTAVVLDNTTAYAEMGGQVGDTGELVHGSNTWCVANTQKTGHTWLHFLEGADAPEVGAGVTFLVDAARRNAIQRHHTVTHLLHWALHEVVSKEATQKGSFVGPDKLTFDFNSGALTPQQVRDIERLVNQRIVENAGVSWTEVPYADIRGRADVMQFFGDKYGETVRVVQIGGQPAALDGYSMELCAGTHTRATGEIGLFRINAEAAIAAGVRRIEAVAGGNAYELATADMQRLSALAAKLGTPLADLEKRVEGLLQQQKDLEKSLKSAQQREAAGKAKDLLASAETINGTPAIIANLGAADGDTLQTVADSLKGSGFKGVVVLGGTANGAVALVAAVTPDFTAKAQAGKIIQTVAPLVGGKGGGKPDNARGGGKDPGKLDAALAHARTLLT